MSEINLNKKVFSESLEPLATIWCHCTYVKAVVYPIMFLSLVLVVCGL